MLLNATQSALSLITTVVDQPQVEAEQSLDGTFATLFSQLQILSGETEGQNALADGALNTTGNMDNPDPTQVGKMDKALAELLDNLQAWLESEPDADTPSTQEQALLKAALDKIQALMDFSDATPDVGAAATALTVALQAPAEGFNQQAMPAVDVSEAVGMAFDVRNGEASILEHARSEIQEKPLKRLSVSEVVEGLGDLAANFAGVAEGERVHPAFLNEREARMSQRASELAKTLKQLEGLLQQRLEGNASPKVGEERDIRDTQSSHEILKARPVMDGLDGELEEDSDRALKRLSLDSGSLDVIKARVKALFDRLEAQGAEGARRVRETLARSTQVAQQAQVEADDQVSAWRGLFNEDRLAEGVSAQGLTSVPVTPHREATSAVMMQPLSQAMKAMQSKMDMEDMADQDQSSEGQEERMAQSGTERAAGSGTMRAVASITLPLRHPQWGAQLAQRVMLLAQNNQNLAQIRLNPAHLGPIQVKLKMEADSGVQVSLHAHHALTREAIEQAVPRLRELFQQQGLTLSDVTVQPDERGHAQAFADARRDQNGQSSSSSLESARVEEDEGPQAVRPALYRVNGLVDQFV